MSRIKLLLDVAEDLSALAGSLRTLAQAIASDEPEAAEAAPVAPPPPGPPAPAPSAPVKTITLAEVRADLGERSRQGFTDEVRGLLQRYGADKLSEVDPKHYEALLKDAEVLVHAT